MFLIREDLVSHSLLTPVLESVQELPVRHGTVLVGGNATPRQEGCQELLLKVQTVLTHHIQEIVEQYLQCFETDLNIRKLKQR